MAEINKGVEMILARMDSHPAEFDKNTTTGRFGRWTFAIDDVLKSDCFTEEERELVSNKLRDVKRGRFTEEVMKELLRDPAEREKWDTVRMGASSQSISGRQHSFTVYDEATTAKEKMALEIRKAFEERSAKWKY